jgi:polyhydroxyalkanoate synthesis regulator phasin
MGKRLVAVGGAVAAAIAAGAVLVGTVFAAGPGPNAGNGADIGGRDIPLAVASELTGLTEEQLLAELEGGKTIPALLEEMGIDVSVFHQEVAEARQAAVDAAVAEGTLTQEQAQTMLQNMEQNQASEGPHGPQYGEGRRLGECDGDGEQHQYGSAAATSEGKSWGEPGGGTGPGEEHRYGGSTR